MSLSVAQPNRAQISFVLIVNMRDSLEKRWSVNSNETGGYSKKNWVGECGPPPKTLTLFMTKICDIPYPIYDLTLKSKPCLRAAL